MLDRITPVILTYNEEANIERTLQKVRWAKDIVLLDSFSTDQTLEISKKFPQVRVLQRKFDTHANQWNFGLKEAAIQTEWILALDADYVVTEKFTEELKQLNPPEDVVGYQAEFVYCIYGRPLRGTVYPPHPVLFRKSQGCYEQDGHTHRLHIDGKVEKLKAFILHDDWKPLTQWLLSQEKYAKLEVIKLIESRTGDLDFPDRFRKMGFWSPFAMLFYCLFAKGLIWDGYCGWYYTFQRVFAETALCLYLTQYNLKRYYPQLDVSEILLKVKPETEKNNDHSRD